MEGLQEAIDFVMANRAFFAFLAALAGYIATKVKGAARDERIGRQEAALEGVARAVEEFQGRLSSGDPLATEDPKALKKAIAYRVSKGREELDSAISRSEAPRFRERRRPALLDILRAVARVLLP